MKGSLCSDINFVYSPVNISKSLIFSCSRQSHSFYSSWKKLFLAFPASPPGILCCHSPKNQWWKGTKRFISSVVRNELAGGGCVSFELPCIMAACSWCVLKYCSHRYIHQPLLLEGKKFDVRSYLLIACTAPYVLFFAQGYIRLTCVNYDAASDDLTVHLTNQVN